MWLAIALGFIFFVIARGMVPKIQATVDEREKKIAGDLEAAQKGARRPPTRPRRRGAERMDAARAEAARLAQEAKQASARETEAKVKKPADKINLKVEAAEAKIREALAVRPGRDRGRRGRSDARDGRAADRDSRQQVDGSSEGGTAWLSRT